MPEDPGSEYDVALSDPAKLTAAQVSACVAIIRGGGAVDPGTAKAEMPLSAALALASKRGVIVGVGAIKRVRRVYAATIAKRGGHPFPPDTPELGYVAVHPDHQRKGLSGRLVAALLQTHKGRLFATTYTEAMKRTLAAARFARKGDEWKSRKGERLSLWIRE